MEATTFLSDSRLLGRPFSPGKLQFLHRRTSVSAFNRGNDAVDENIIELRVRIRELKMEEACNNPPSHWMDWEKDYFQYSAYYNHVYQVVGIFQNFLLNLRPCFGLGFVLVVFMSVPVSTGLLFFHLLGMVKMIFG